MTTLIAAIGWLAAAAAPQPAWTWTLYDTANPVVFANEIPDTPQLKATLECDAGSGLVRVSLYGSSLGAGVATLASGEVAAAAQVDQDRDRSAATVLRTDHPVFARFTSTGQLHVTVAEQTVTVDVGAPYRVKLRRFADLCGG